MSDEISDTPVPMWFCEPCAAKDAELQRLRDELAETKNELECIIKDRDSWRSQSRQHVCEKIGIRDVLFTEKAAREKAEAEATVMRSLKEHLESHHARILCGCAGCIVARAALAARGPK